jgi:hypothetical protein
MADFDDDGAASALRLAVYKRLMGSLALYLSFFTAAHLFCVLGGALLEPAGVTVFFLGREQSVLTVVELVAAGLLILRRGRATCCAGVTAVLLPLLMAALVFALRVALPRGGALFDARAYGTPADWSNAKAVHVAAAYAAAFRGHVLWAGAKDWAFLMAACVMAFYGKYCVLATHRSVQRAFAKVARLAHAGACCLCGGHAGTFFFLLLHAAAGGVVAAVLCSRLGLNDRFVDKSTGQIVDVYDRMAALLPSTPGCTLRNRAAGGAAGGGGGAVSYDDGDNNGGDGGGQSTRFLMQHWFWTIFGVFNGLLAAVLHVLGDRNVLAPVASRPVANGKAPASGLTITTVCTGFGARLADSVVRAGCVAVLAVAGFAIASLATHWMQHSFGDVGGGGAAADGGGVDNDNASSGSGDAPLLLPLLDADGDGRVDGLNAIAGRLLDTVCELTRLAWGIHFVLDVAQLALDECVALPVDLAADLLSSSSSSSSFSAAAAAAASLSSSFAGGGGDAEFGLRAAMAVLDHTASSQLEYLLKCYHGGLDGLTGDDNRAVHQRRARGAAASADDDDNATDGFGGRRRLRGGRRSVLSRLRRRRGMTGGGGRAGAVAALGSGDDSDTDSDSDSSLGSDPDEDGDAQTPWRREPQQGALRFHNVALRSVYVVAWQQCGEV